MKKLIAILLVTVLLTACGGGGGKQEETKPPLQFTDVDYLSIIRADLLTEDTELSHAMDQALKLQLEQVQEDSITVTVIAPDICQGTLDWFCAVSEKDYSDEALTETMLELLKGQPKTNTYTLSVSGEKITYTDEFLNAASCGVRRFYTALTVMLMEEMEASVNG